MTDEREHHEATDVPADVIRRATHGRLDLPRPELADLVAEKGDLGKRIADAEIAEPEAEAQR